MPSQMVKAYIVIDENSRLEHRAYAMPYMGKPLVYRCIEALEACRPVDSIVVVTGDDDIADIVCRGHYAKTVVYRVSPDHDVMQWYLESTDLRDDTLFIVIQMPSPVVLSCHYAEALDLYRSGRFDTLLTSVRGRRDVDDKLTENGPFFITRFGNLTAFANPLFGRIGIYEVPPMAVEIDEADDPLARIQLFITDVDGTLTDGGMYYSEHGDEMKKFNTRDGMGLRLLSAAGLRTAIITGEQTRLVERRGQKLQIDRVVQGSHGEGKLAAARELCAEWGIEMDRVAYVGDDVNCVALLSAVGCPACPSDACPEVMAIPGIRVLSRPGGAGCVREYIDMILRSRRRAKAGEGA